MKCMNGNTIANPWGSLHSVRPVKRVADMLRQGLSEDAIRRELKERFSVSDSKISLALSVAAQELATAGQLGEGSAAVYVDIPFCPTKCAYCSFASVSADRMKTLAEPYLAALYRDLDTIGRIVKDLNFTIKSLYIGGGTPTTLLALELDNLLYKLSQTFDCSQLSEWTVEAGRPDTITPEKLAVMRNRGVTRVSVNPQTVHDRTLARIGRRHTAESVFKAVELVRQFEFPVLNMDVIAGLPGEALADFQDTLRTVAACQPENLTVHTMSIKRASRLNQESFVPSDAQHRTAAEMLDFAYSFLSEQGYKGYYLYRQKNTLGNLENTGFCLPGQACLYNIAMMEDMTTVFGAGAGAVTKLVRPGRIERVFNVKDVAEYISRQAEMRKRKQHAYAFFDGYTPMN